MSRLRLLPLIIVWVWPAATGAQVRPPQDFLGYMLGEAFTPHHRVVDYFEHVAEESPLVTLEHYGATYEGRPLLYVVTSSPQNMERLEEIRISNLQRAQLAEGEPTGAAPAIVWLSYNVHGNESASTEAAIATLFALTDSGNVQVQTWLKDTVVIIDPCINPDGRERYVSFYRQTRGRVPNYLPVAREHREPWPGGRTNHYYFDLNRDWAWGTQAETQQRLPQYQKWMPHIHVDFHEQGVNEPYYFAPAAEPFHQAITPWQREFQEHIGRNHARYFDDKGWLYFTRQIFDLFYPGYGDTWPTFNGAIGMTYEQGGSGRAGQGVVTAEGDTLTLRDRIDHHFTTSLSTIETAAVYRERIVDEFSAFFRSIPDGPYAAYLVKGGHPDKTQALARHLTMQGITFGSVSSPWRGRGFAYGTQTMEPVTVDPGDMVISTRQPRRVLAHVLFEPTSVLYDSLSYDITAWALPYVYGLEAYALPHHVQPNAPWHPRRDTEMESPHRPVAYIAEWRSFADAQLLAALLESGVKVRFSEKSFVTGERAYGPGTLIVTRGTNDHLGDAFDQAVRAVAELSQQTLLPVSSTLVARGVDFGSSDVPYLKKPRVAIVGGAGSSPYGLGELWHFFDQQLAYPVTVVNTDGFGSLHLYDFDVVILSGGAYVRQWSDAVLNRITTWIESGGRLIVIEGAARALAGKDGFSLKKKEEEDRDGPEDSDDEDKEMSERRIYGERDRYEISEDVTGAIFRVDLDTTHPLAFGYAGPYFTLKRHSDAYQLLEDDWNVGILQEDAHVSGFVGYKAHEPLKHSLLFGVQPKGRGEIVYLLDDPLFRGFWYNGRLLLANAVFLVGQRSISNF